MEELGRFSPFAGMTRIRFKGFGLKAVSAPFGTPLEQHQMLSRRVGMSSEAGSLTRRAPVAHSVEPALAARAERDRA